MNIQDRRIENPDIKSSGKMDFFHELECTQIESSPRLIVKIIYDEDESIEFNNKLHSREYSTARMDNLSEHSSDKMLFSGGHVPCHAILFKSSDGKNQIFHVQPNKMSYSLLTFDQDKQLKELSRLNTKCIVINGIRSWYGNSDKKELERCNIENIGSINLDTSNWWRILYDNIKDEIWIDMKVERTLLKFKGFDFNVGKIEDMKTDIKRKTNKIL